MHGAECALTFPQNVARHQLTGLLPIHDSPDDELERAKTKIATRVVLQGESSMRRLMAIGNDWVYREEYLTLQEELERIKKVSRDDINQMLEQYPSTPYTTVKLIPG